MSWEKLEIRRDSPAAIGVEHCEDGSAILHVPIAYATDLSTAEARRGIFIEIFQVLKRFAGQFSSAKLLAGGESLSSTRKTGGQSRVHDKQPAHPAGYYLLDLLSQLLSEIAEPSVLTVASRQQMRHSHLDTRHISRYLHLALYQDDGSAVFEGMPARQTIVREESSDLIGLAAWLCRDLLKYFYAHDLSDEFETDAAAELGIIADAFAAKHLHHEMACVMTDAESAKTLREALHTVEARTPFKPPKFNDIFDTVDKLLTAAIAKNGQFFGVEKFYNVWESLCLQAALAIFPAEQVFSCDTQFLQPGSALRSDRNRWQRNAAAAFDKNAIARRPDLVIDPRGAGGQWSVIDFKYYGAEAMRQFPITCGRGKQAVEERLEEKLQDDLISGEIYRMLLANHLREAGAAISHEDIRLEFWIPGLENSGPHPIDLDSDSGRFSHLYYRTVCIRDAAHRYISS